MKWRKKAPEPEAEVQLPRPGPPQNEPEPACCTFENATGVEHLAQWELEERFGRNWQSTGQWQNGRCGNGVVRWHWMLDEITDVRNDRTEWTATVLPAETGLVGTSVPGQRKRVGIQSAADYLGMKYDAFEQARKRYQRMHGRIPGEHRVGNQPAWTEADLDAWAAGRPRSARPAVPGDDEGAAPLDALYEAALPEQAHGPSYGAVGHAVFLSYVSLGTHLAGQLAGPHTPF